MFGIENYFFALECYLIIQVVNTPGFVSHLAKSSGKQLLSYWQFWMFTSHEGNNYLESILKLTWIKTNGLLNEWTIYICIKSKMWIMKSMCIQKAVVHKNLPRIHLICTYQRIQVLVIKCQIFTKIFSF